MFLSSKNLTAYCSATGIKLTGDNIGKPPNDTNELTTCSIFTFGEINLSKTSIGLPAVTIATSTGVSPREPYPKWIYFPWLDSAGISQFIKIKNEAVPTVSKISPSFILFTHRYINPNAASNKANSSFTSNKDNSVMTPRCFLPISNQYNPSDNNSGIKAL